MALLRRGRLLSMLPLTFAFGSLRCPTKRTPAATDDAFFFPYLETTTGLPFWWSRPATWAATARLWESRHGGPARAASG